MILYHFMFPHVHIYAKNKNKSTRPKEPSKRNKENKWVIHFSSFDPLLFHVSLSTHLRTKTKKQKYDPSTLKKPPMDKEKKMELYLMCACLF
jgi:hypothetical protein